MKTLALLALACISMTGLSAYPQYTYPVQMSPYEQQSLYNQQQQLRYQEQMMIQQQRQQISAQQQVRQMQNNATTRIGR